MKKQTKTILILLALLAPVFVFGADDDFAVPLVDMIKTWAGGNVGLAAALAVMAIGAVWGAFGGGFAAFGKSLIWGIVLGGVLFFADKAFNIGKGFSDDSSSSATEIHYNPQGSSATVA